MPAAALAFDDVGTGPAVVLLHGHPFDRSMWEPQLRSLSGGFRVVAPDLRGFGQSPPTAGTVTMAELAADVEALLTGLGIDAFAAVGLSMGALVAMEMAIGRPQRVWALGLVATTAQPVGEDERRGRLALADAVEAGGMAPLLRRMGPGLLGPAADERLAARVQEMMAASSPAGAAAALRGRAARPDYRDGLRGLTIPAFVCTGTDDVWSTPAVTAELVGCLRRPRRLTLPGVGHLPNLEDPVRFDDALASFLHGAAPRP